MNRAMLLTLAGVLLGSPGCGRTPARNKIALVPADLFATDPAAGGGHLMAAVETWLTLRMIDHLAYMDMPPPPGDSPMGPPPSPATGSPHSDRASGAAPPGAPARVDIDLPAGWSSERAEGGRPALFAASTGAVHVVVHSLAAPTRLVSSGALDGANALDLLDSAAPAPAPGTRATVTRLRACHGAIRRTVAGSSGARVVQVAIADGARLVLVEAWGGPAAALAAQDIACHHLRIAR